MPPQNDLFIKLFELQSDKVKPLENFSTELLAAVLNNNRDLLDLFVEKILHIEGSNFSLQTQVHYPRENGSAYIDLVFKNEDSICFLENKVNSKEGKMQLETYSQILKKQTENPKQYLRYCTKYTDPKTVEDIDFKQFRWYEVAAFLDNFPKKETDTLRILFLSFLNHHNMSQEIDFSDAEKESLPCLLKMTTPIFKKCFGILDNISREFRTNFAYSKAIAPPADDLAQRSRIVLYTKNVLSSQVGYCDIVVGFDFKSEPASAFFSFYFDKNIRHYQNFLDFFEKEKLKEYPSYGYAYQVYKSLKAFKNSEEIQDWLVETMKGFKKLIKQMQPEIQWAFSPV